MVYNARAPLMNTIYIVEREREREMEKEISYGVHLVITEV